MIRLVALITVLLVSRSAHAADARSLLQQATEAYTEGAALLASSPPDPDAARAAFVRSRDAHAQAVAALDDASPQLLSNLASASYLAGDTAHAVLWWKRAARLAPNDATIKANLGVAREKVAAPVRRDDSLLQQLTILEFVPPAARFWTAALALAGAWTLALLRLRSTGWQPTRLHVAASAGVAILAGASLIPRELRLREPRECVVMTETTGRAGPDSVAYDPKPGAPLPPGAEARIIETRGDWTLLELPNDTTSWVPTKNIERINPSQT